MTALLAGLVTGCAGLTVWWLLTVALAAAGRGPGPSGPLVAVAAGAGAVVCVRLGLSALATFAYGLASVARPRSSRRATSTVGTRFARLALLASPRAARPLVSLLVAGGLAVGTATTAAAGTPAPLLPRPGWSAESTLPSPDLPSPTWTPQRPAPAPRRQPDVTLVAAAAGRDGANRAPDVVVRRGDTLWSIAARQLGPGATSADIAEAWPRWWQANRQRIGADPDLLLPGQVLTAPRAGAAR